MSRVSSQSVLVSTTPDLQGWDITHYHGAVSAHVVAGTNIFSDIAASWRDVFGGQSKSYKKQLEQINEKVVDELKEEASQRGANALIGLQIDHDQISGQQSSITAREAVIEERTVRLLQKNQEGNLRLSDEIWRFLIENQVTDFGGVIQATITEILERPGLSQKQKKHLENGADYFLSIPEAKAKEHLYDMVRREDRSVMEWAVDILENGNLLDLGRIESMLGGDFYTEQKPALEILTRVDRPYYDHEDLDRLKALRAEVERGFEKRGEVFETEVSGTFTSSTKKVWQIKEGAHNSMNQEYCSETGLDIYGFGKTEARPEEATDALETKISALNRRLGNS
jgi:uncharacterized protein YbjQ (UPF0145 family)